MIEVINVNKNYNGKIKILSQRFEMISALAEGIKSGKSLFYLTFKFRFK